MQLREATMSTLDAIRQEIEKIPEPLLDEVLDFVRFLTSRATRARFETAVASEPALGVDWLRPEEDAAWDDL